MPRVNPASATKKYCEMKGGCGIQEINDICFGVASAFNGNCNVWDIPESYAQNCNELVNEARKTLFDADRCDHQTPYRPLVLNRTRQFPRLYAHSGNIQQALRECIQNCDSIECQKNCYIDSYAVSGGGEEETDMLLNSGNLIPYSDTKTSNLVIISSILGFVLLSFVIYYIGISKK